MSMFSYTTIGIGNKDVTQINTTVGLARRLEIGDWAACSTPDKSDVIFYNADTRSEVAERFARDHHLVALSGKHRDHPNTPFVLEQPASYTAIIALFKSLEMSILANRLDSPAPASEAPESTLKAADAAARDKATTNTRQQPPAIEAVQPRPAASENAPTSDTPKQSATTAAEPPRPTASDDATASDAPKQSPSIEAEPPRPAVAKVSKATVVTIKQALPSGSDTPGIKPVATKEPQAAQVVAPISLKKPTEEPSKEAAKVPEPAPTKNKDDKPAKPAVSLTVVKTTRKSRPAEVVPSLDNVVRPARRFYPASRLLGTIRSIIANGTSAEISHPDFPPLSIFPVSEWFQFAMPLEECPELFRISSTEFTYREISSQRKPRATQEWSPQPLWALSYSAAYYGSEGRLLQHCAPYDLLQLISMPDFGSIPHTPEHKRLAEYLLTHQSDIETIARDTGITLSTVIDFTNACHETRLLARVNLPGNDEAPTKTTNPARPEKSQRKTNRYRVFSWLKSPFSR
jgi:hypothetical protein